MGSTKIIKQKIKAITSIKKITKTMEMVAVSKMKKSVKEALDMSYYITELKHIIESIRTVGDNDHILLSNLKHKAVDELVIIYAANKGLAGSFNGNVYKQTKKLLENSPNVTKAICIGKFAEKAARKLNLEIVLSFLEIEKVSNVYGLSKLEDYVRRMYINDEVKKVHVIYTNFVKMGVYSPESVTIYPLSSNISKYSDTFETEKQNTNVELYTLEPSVGNILNLTIPKMIKTLLFSYALESRASENSSRSFAMKRANESAGEMLGDLKIKFNKIRQDGITQEIAEISAGANV